MSSKEIRSPSKNDQKKLDKAFKLIIDLMNKNKDIEPNLWCGAVWSILVNGYKQSDFSYDEFCQEINKISNHYKCWFDNDH